MNQINPRRNVLFEWFNQCRTRSAGFGHRGKAAALSIGLMILAFATVFVAVQREWVARWLASDRSIPIISWRRRRDSRRRTQYRRAWDHDLT